jgi:KTSC domain
MAGTADGLRRALDGYQVQPNSTAIERWQWVDNGDGIGDLRIKFRGGNWTYPYMGVPEEVVAGLYQAPSVGTYYGAVIKGRYRTLTKPPAPRARHQATKRRR